MKIKNWSKIGNVEWYNKKMKIWLRVGGSGTLYNSEPPYYVEIKHGEGRWRSMGVCPNKESAIREAVLYMKKYK